MEDAEKKKTVELSELIKTVEEKIVVVRGRRMLLDRDIAFLYGVETREVNQAVRNNPQKFPEGYVLELSANESAAIRSNFLTIEKNGGRGRHSKYKLKHTVRRVRKDKNNTENL